MSSETRTPDLSLAFGTELRVPTRYRGPDEALTMTVKGACQWPALDQLASPTHIVLRLAA